MKTELLSPLLGLRNSMAAFATTGSASSQSRRSLHAGRLSPISGSHVFLAACLVMGGAWTAAAQQVKEDNNEVTLLRAEVQRLSLELLRHRADFIQWKIHWIGAELQQVQAERQRFTEKRRLIEQELGELSQFSGNTADGGGEDHLRRAELSNAQLPVVEASERAAVKREAELTAALRAESNQIAEIRQRLQSLDNPRPGGR